MMNIVFSQLCRVAILAPLATIDIQRQDRVPAKYISA
jgi:hypothetical protein